jgi:hypothetical protein
LTSACKKQLRDILNHSKSELEDWSAREQQLQADDIEAEQQLRRTSSPCSKHDWTNSSEAWEVPPDKLVGFLIDLSQESIRD